MVRIWDNVYILFKVSSLNSHSVCTGFLSMLYDSIYPSANNSMSLSWLGYLACLVTALALPEEWKILQKRNNFIVLGQSFSLQVELHRMNMWGQENSLHAMGKLVLSDSLTYANWQAKLYSLFVTGLDVQILLGVVCPINVSTQPRHEQNRDMTDTVSHVPNHCYRRPTLYNGTFHW